VYTWVALGLKLGGRTGAQGTGQYIFMGRPNVNFISVVVFIKKV